MLCSSVQKGEKNWEILGWGIEKWFAKWLICFTRLHKNSTGFGFRLTKFRKAMLSNQQVYDVGKVVLSCLRIEKEISVSDAY